MSPIRRLLNLLRPEFGDIAIVVAFSIGVGVLALSAPIAVQALVNFVAFGGLVQPLVILGLVLLVCLGMAGLMRAFTAYVVEILQRRLFVRVVADLGYRLPRVRIDAYDRHHGPELVNRFFDVLTVQKVGATLLLDGVAAVLQTIIGLLILAFYHPVLLAFAVILIFGILSILFVLGRGAVVTAIIESKAKYAVAASLEEIARNPLTFRFDGGADYAFQRADSLAMDYVKARRKHFAVVFRQILGALGLQALAATALLTLGGWLVIEGQLTLGQLVASELIVSIVLASFTKFGKKLEGFYDLLAAVDKLGQLMDLPLERSYGEDHVIESEGASVMFHDMSFGFDEQRLILKDFSLAIAPGERICIAGGHGFGKSTLAELLSGLRTPTLGRIEIDGVDLREQSLKSLRENVSVVKGLEVIDGTIEDNVRMNRQDVTATDVRKALSYIGLLEEIRNLPDGMQTVLTSTAAPLSYGQARRLMLARAIVGKPRVLVLDDLLDDMDTEAGREVEKLLTDKDRQWTVIVLTRNERLADLVDRVVRLPKPMPNEAPAAAGDAMLMSTGGGA